MATLRIFISADMEGCTGISHLLHTKPGAPEYKYGTECYKHDIRAVAEALTEEGAEVVIADSHWYMRNITVHDLPRGAELVAGNVRILGMVEGAAGCDGALFVGYHSMSGTERAVLDHTMSTFVYDFFLNGTRRGETCISAMLCGELGVPVAMVTGDEALCYEASSLLGQELITCVTKEGLGRQTARLIDPATTSDMLRGCAKEAFLRIKDRKCSPFRIEPPYVADISFISTSMADAASMCPGVCRMDGRTIRFETDSSFEMHRYFRAVLDCVTASRS